MGGVILVLALLLAPLWLVPRFAKEQIERRLEKRGLTFRCADADVRFRGLRFRDVVIERGGKRIASVRELAVSVRWFQALRDARSAIESVRVSELSADLAVDDLRALRGQAQTEASEAKASAGSAAVPELRVTGASLKLRDERGVLVATDAPLLTLSASEWHAEVDKVEVGVHGDESLALRGVEASGPLEGRRPRLQKADIEEATLVWNADAGTDSPGLRARIKAARSALRGEKREGADSEGGSSSSLWTKDARLALREARAIERSGSEQNTILQRLRVELAAVGEQSLRARGDGATATGGKLHWDLELAPSEAKVEGRVSFRDVPVALVAPALPRLPFHELERTRVSADLAITGKGLETASVRGELSIADLAFASERIARAPVGPVTFTARGAATWTPARRELSELRGELVSRDVRVLVTGALAWPTDGYRVDLRAELPKAKCASVAATVPPGILDELATIQLAGDIKAKLDVHVDSADLDATKLDFDFDDKCKFIELPELMNVARFERPFTHRVLEPDDTVFEFETGPGTPAWTPIELISPFMIQAVVAHEDGRFFNHHGFAETEIGAALARNLKAKAFKFGASTITMQLVKNVFLHRDKLLSRKFQEALIVWWLEQQVDKKWILELYLNVIEYGTGIYGIRNAALHYFGTLPIHLTPAQAAFLATILPSPKSYDEQYTRGYPSDSTKQRVVTFLKHMRSRDRIDDEALTYGIEEIAQMRFYNPDQPPPVPSPMRGAALAPPFSMGPSEGANTFDPTKPKVEDGSFGWGL